MLKSFIPLTENVNENPIRLYTICRNLFAIRIQVYLMAGASAIGGELISPEKSGRFVDTRITRRKLRRICQFSNKA